MLDIKVKPSEPLVSASILSADFGKMIEDCEDVLGRGADLLHIDVMDGHFVPNLTMGQDMIKGLRRHLSDTYLDVHLMVERPDEYVDSFAAAGANMFTFHLEVCSESGGTIEAASMIEKVKNAGMHVGMVINPPTSPVGLQPYLEMLDMVLVMSVNPGRSGQKFMPEVLEKVKWLRQQSAENLRVEMDGGLSPVTAPSAIEAGVDVIVSASALFGAEDRSVAIHGLKGN